MKKFLLPLALLTISCTTKEEPVVITINDVEIKSSPQDLCQVKIDELVPAETNPGYHYMRLALLRMAKGSPIVFEREPLASDTKRSKSFRSTLNKPGREWNKLKALLPIFKHKPQLGRESVLREGYLFHTNPAMAVHLVENISLSHMFNEKEIWIQRGDVTMKATRQKDYYTYSTGPIKNERANVLLFDRITTEEPTDSLHVDFRQFIFDHGNFSIMPIHIDNKFVIAKAAGNGHDFNVLFKRDKAKLEVDCHTSESNNFIIRGGEESLKEAMVHMVNEKIPFDEPLHEYGQQLDGRLRDKWIGAYYKGFDKYSFNGDNYHVYDYLGRPKPPQVCVDFLVDAIDRASGTWFLNKKHRRTRSIGKFDSRKYTNEYALRNVTGITKFATDHPEWFDVIEYKSKIKMGSPEFYLEFMPSIKLQVGDMVFVKGEVPWDNKEHSHSFFIFENDPIINEPILLAGNAGPAALRAWHFETRRTPDRYIFRVIRMKEKFFELISPGIDRSTPIVIR